MGCVADERGDGGAYLDAFAILWCGEGAGIRLAFRRGLAGSIFVFVKVINSNLVERVQVVMAHGGVREAIEPGAVGDEGDDALTIGVGGDAAFGDAVGLVELGAEQVVDALDHILDDFARGVPDAELLAELGVEGFEEGLVEVGDGFFALEDVKEVGLDAVEGFAGELKNSVSWMVLRWRRSETSRKSLRRMGTLR